MIKEIYYHVLKVKNADLLSKCQCCDEVNCDLEHFTAEADKWLGLGTCFREE